MSETTPAPSKPAQDGPTAGTTGDMNQSAPETKSQISKGFLMLLILMLTTLIWYLFADRYTPSTSQARVQSYVVGVAPKVAGVITDIWVKNNTRVKAGEKLFAIDSSQYEIAVQSAQANIDNTLQQVSAGDSAVEQARANLRAAKASQLKAEQDYNRLKRLREDDPGTVSERRLEVSQASLEQTKAQVAAAQAGIQGAIEQKGGDSADNNTLLQAAQTGLDKARLDLNNTTVVAQSDGVITNLQAEVGQFAGTGNPVLTLVTLQDIWISADFTENNLGHLKPGTKVDIVLDAMPGQVFEGRIRDIGVGISAGSAPPPGALPTVQNSRDWLRQAQRFPVQVEFTEPPSDQVLQNLRIGGQATVIAYTEHHGLLEILGKGYIHVLSYLSFAY